MNVQVEVDGTSTPVAIAIEDPAATVQHLADALGVDVTGRHLLIDGIRVEPWTTLRSARLVEGSVVAFVSGAEPDTAPTTGSGPILRMGVARGPDAGSAVAVSSGSHTIGRRGDALELTNDTISERHAVLDIDPRGEMTIVDTDSHNGTWIDGAAVRGKSELRAGQPVRVGSSVIVVDHPDNSDRPVGVGPDHADDAGRILFNRPPRPAPVPENAPIEVPGLRPERRNPAFSLVALVVPVVFAGVMIQVTGRWQYAMFALLSPLMFLGNYVTGRRRVRRERRADETSRDEALNRFRRRFTEAVDRELARRSAVAPDLLEVRRRVELPSRSLWERRHESVDAMTVKVGHGEVAWEPPLVRGSEGTDDAAEAVIADNRQLADVEQLVDFRIGPLGLVGHPPNCRAVARSVVLQLVTHHGPADVSLAVFTSSERLAEWSWITWLPHAVDTDGSVRVLTGDASEEFAQRLEDVLGGDDSATGGSGPARLRPGWLLIVDDLSLVHGRSSPVRRLLQNTDRRVFGAVLAATGDQLPASIRTICSIDEHAEIRHIRVDAEHDVSIGIADLVSARVAGEISRAMARFEDPEQRIPGGRVPVAVRPDAVWHDIAESVETIIGRWAEGRPRNSLEVTVGIGENGSASIDLVADGPHALIAGTTGAGKSEFLRTLVLGLSLGHDPDDLVFVLIDYKGGSAFDCCSRLPHVVGMVTDLDDHLAERALESLEAELRRRERVLRSAEAADIVDYRSLNSPNGPLPRLVVIIDEFATLRAELPDFVTALVGIAQRGRSLGVHLVLATQRPSGAVDANIRANTNLRVALRVQDDADSTDVIDTKDAANIPRSIPGRAFIRRGQGDVVPVQTVFVSGLAPTPSACPVRVAPIPVGSGAPPRFPAAAVDSELTDLELIVERIREAAVGRPPPDRPWLDDLPPIVEPGATDGLAAGDDATVVLAVGDRPAEQRRVTIGWNPDDGHLVLYGVHGSGITTALRSLVHRLGSGVEGRPVWVYVVDHGAGGLVGIDRLDHVGCRLEPTETARHERLLTMLAEELDERRSNPAPPDSRPLVVVVIDGLAGFCELTGTGNAGERSELFNRIVRDGPAVGMVLVAGTMRPGDVPRALAATVRRHFVLELANPSDHHMLGIRARTLPAFRPGRALVGVPPTVTQIIDWSTVDDIAPMILERPPPPVETLPAIIDRSGLASRARIGAGLEIPFAIDDHRRDVVSLDIRSGEHVLVAGPAGSGRTTTLATLARQLRAADSTLVLVALAPRNDGDLFTASVFDATGTAADLRNVLDMARSDPRRWVLFVDDADQIDLDDGPLIELVRHPRDELTIIAAARSSTLRQAYGHWLRHVRTSGIGVLLSPDNGVDGELLAVRLPRGERLPELPGRGYLIRSGRPTVIQVAR